MDSDASAAAIVLKNVNKNDVKILLLVYRDEQTSGGGTVIKHDYCEYGKELVIYYESSEIANRVVQFGEVVFCVECEKRFTATPMFCGKDNAPRAIIKNLEVDYVYWKFIKENLSDIRTLEGVTCELNVAAVDESNFAERFTTKRKLEFKSHDTVKMVSTAEFIRSRFTHECVPIDPIHVPNMRYKHAELFSRIEQFCLNSKTNYDFCEIKRKFYCAGEKQRVQDLAGIIKRYIEEMEVREVDVSREFSEKNFRYLQIVKHDEIEEYCRDILHRRLDIDFHRKIIIGKKADRESLLNKLNEMIGKSKTESHTLKLTPTMANLLEESTDLADLAKREKSLIVIRSRRDHVPAQAAMCDENNWEYVKNIFGVNMCVVKSSIESFENADVICIGSKCDLTGFCHSSKVILSAVGDDLNLQLENQELFEGQSILTHSGEFENCRHLIHAIVPNDLIRDPNEIRYLKQCIRSALESCLSLDKPVSVAFPLFYGGVQYIVDAMLVTISDFLREKTPCNINEIFIVDQQYHNLVTESLKSITRGRVKLYKGCITESACDAIVNLTTRDLKMISKVAMTIKKKGGDRIEEELKKKYPGGLKSDTEIAVTNSGNLPNIKFILHILLDTYSDELPIVEQKFKDVLWNVLKVASENDCVSIGLPVLGTGVAKYPKEISCKWMLETIYEYFKTTQNTALKWVLVSMLADDAENCNNFEATIYDSSDDDEVNSNSNQVDRRQRISYEITTRSFKDIKAKVGSVSVLVCIDDNGTQRCCNSSSSISAQTRNLNLAEIVALNDVKKSIALSLHELNMNHCKIAVYQLIEANTIKTNKAIRQVLKGFSIFLSGSSVKLEIETIKVSIVNSKNIFEKFCDEIKHFNRYGYCVERAKKKMREYVGIIVEKPKTELTFDLISDEDNRISLCKSGINEIINKHRPSRICSDAFIGRLNTHQIVEIKSLCDKYDAECHIDNSLERIKLTCVSRSITECYNAVLNLINTFRNQEFIEVTELAKEIQWEYSSKESNKRKRYCLYENEQIQKAFHNSRDKIYEFTDEYDVECYIDFNKKAQYRKSDGEFMYDVYQVSCKDVHDLRVPNDWTDGKICDLVRINPNSNEYTKVTEILFKSFIDNVRLVSIDRVQHRRLYCQYEIHKKAFEERLGVGSVNEKTLFHGTVGGSVCNIWTYGFDRSFAGKNATFFGKGVYFARDASYSHNYTNLGTNGHLNASGNRLHAHIFVCNVLLGNCAVGDKHMDKTNLPKAPDGKTPVDSTVNKLNDPSIVVIYHDAQAYPKYLVTYEEI